MESATQACQFRNAAYVKHSITVPGSLSPDNYGALCMCFQMLAFRAYILHIPYDSGRAAVMKTFETELKAWWCFCGKLLSIRVSLCWALTQFPNALPRGWKHNPSSQTAILRSLSFPSLLHFPFPAHTLGMRQWGALSPSTCCLFRGQPGVALHHSLSS